MQNESSERERPSASRRNYLVDRRFQLKYTTILVVIGAAVSLLFGAMMYQAHVEATQLAQLPDNFQRVVTAQARTLLWLVIATSGVMAIALGLVGVLVTHRIAGPIYVFTRYLQILGEGRYPRFRPLRRRDELQNFYEVFHSAVSAMRERDRSEGQALKEMAEALDQAAGTSPQVAELLGPLTGKLREMSGRKLESADESMPVPVQAPAPADQQNAA